MSHLLTSKLASELIYCRPMKAGCVSYHQVAWYSKGGSVTPSHSEE